MTNYEKIKKVYDWLLSFKNDSYIIDSPDFLAWKMECTRVLSNIYGQDSTEVRSFKKLDFRIRTYYDAKGYAYKALATAEIMLYGLLEEMSDDTGKFSENYENKNVFIVHGHDSELKYRISDLLRTIKLNPIILHKQTGSSLTIIEKIEKYGREASAAVVLFTPDDFGNANTEEEKKLRARQNVVFEAGYFMGLLGRSKTLLIISDSSIEIPGDLSGTVYSTTSELDIARELKAMGLPVDLNNLLST